MCLSAARLSLGETGIPVGTAGRWFSISWDEEDFHTAFSSSEKELPLGKLQWYLKMVAFPLLRARRVLEGTTRWGSYSCSWHANAHSTCRIGQTGHSTVSTSLWPQWFRYRWCPGIASLQISEQRFALQPQFSKIHGQPVFSFSIFLLLLLEVQNDYLWSNYMSELKPEDCPFSFKLHECTCKVSFS